MPELVVTDPKGQQARIQLCGQTVVLGRDTHLPLPIADANMSRQHARVYCKKGAYHIEDLNSENGVFLGLVALRKPHRLIGGETFKIADSYVLYQEDAHTSGHVFTLTGASTPCHGSVFPLPSGELGVGSAEDNALCIPHPSVAPYHARLHVTPHAVTVQDLKSLYGTYVLGSPVHTRVLAHNDTLRFGNVDFLFQLHTSHTLAKKHTTQHAYTLVSIGLLLGVLAGVATSWVYTSQKTPSVSEAHQRLWEVEYASLQKAQEVLHHDPKLALVYLKNIQEGSPYEPQAASMRVRAQKLLQAHTRWLATSGH
jgi:pSer/pThr/pTyr-binding forkhead associated (FHA) protein